MDLEDITISEVLNRTDTEGQILHDSTYMRNLKSIVKLTETESRLMGCVTEQGPMRPSQNRPPPMSSACLLFGGKL